MKLTSAVLFAAALACAGPSAAAPSGSGSSGGSYDMPQRQMTPEERARAAFKQGERALKQADKLEAAALEAASDAKKAKAHDRAQSQYRKARDHFVVTVQELREMHEAWNYLGYTSRKLGDYEASLAAYDEALRLQPAFAEAMEYRGETYLALNRIEEAKGEYMKLFRDARPLAERLMAAMAEWVQKRRSDPGALAAADIDAFAQWVDERTKVAEQTASLAVGAELKTWN